MGEWRGGRRGGLTGKVARVADDDGAGGLELVERGRHGDV